MAKVVGVIPARLGSKRLANKALLALDGRPLIYWVWRCALRSQALDRLVIATDSRKIADAAAEFGAEVVMTSRKARNGTERTAEVARKIRADIYVNIQGDNVRFPSGWLARGIEDLKRSRGRLFHTLVTAFESAAEVKNPDRVKVTLVESTGGRRQTKKAGWFSRSIIPHPRSRSTGGASSGLKYYKHLGFYFYRRAGLVEYARWGPGVYERAESLEQLRILECGYEMGVTVVSGKCFTVDSRRDFAQLSRR